MKTIISFFLLSLIIVSCQNPTSNENSLNQISFQTDKTSYTKLDSINIIIENKSNSDFLIGLRCEQYLEMFYQKKGSDGWSENLWFSYMSLKCPTFPDTIKPNSVFKYSMKAEIFDSTGTYRLVLYDNNPIFSNSFKIR